MNERKTTVFIVDDDRESRESVRALATQMGARTKTFHSSEAFLENYDGVEPGCLVAELRPKGMSGLALLKTLRERAAYLPTVIFTGFADVPSAVEAMQLGAFALLEKPIRGLVLWDTIRDALAWGAEYRILANRNADLKSRLRSLTDTERVVVDMIVAGLPNKSIASQLDLSLRTIEARRKTACSKLRVNNLAELVSLVREAEQPLPCCRRALNGM